MGEGQLMPYHQRFTEETKQLAYELAGKGATNKVIARACRIHEDTFQDWLRYGRQGKVTEFCNYAEFYEEIEKIRAELAVKMSEKVIETAMSGLPNTWQAAMTFLERRYPDEWGKRDTTVLERGESTLPQINILVLNDPDARAAHRDLLRSVAGAGSGVPVGPGVGGELEDGSGNGQAVLDVGESAPR